MANPLDVAAVLAALPEAGALALLAKVAQGSKRRAENRLRVLLALGDTPSHPLAAEADAQVLAVLERVGAEGRDPLVQAIKFVPARIRFAPALRAITAHRADPEWAWAVDALGTLRDVGAVEGLMAQTQGIDTPFCLLSALVKLRTPRAEALFRANLAHAEPRTVTFALWGLAALGDRTAVRALVRLLDDPDVHTATSFSPGQNRRAAQALCDVFGWPFEWEEAAVEATRARIAELDLG